MVIKIVNLLEDDFHSKFDKFRIKPEQTNLRYLSEIESPIRKNFCLFINMESAVGKKSYEIKHKAQKNDATLRQEDLD